MGKRADRGCDDGAKTDEPIDLKYCCGEMAAVKRCLCGRGCESQLVFLDRSVRDFPISTVHAWRGTLGW